MLYNRFAVEYGTNNNIASDSGISKSRGQAGTTHFRAKAWPS